MDITACWSCTAVPGSWKGSLEPEAHSAVRACHLYSSSKLRPLWFWLKISCMADSSTAQVFSAATSCVRSWQHSQVVTYAVAACQGPACKVWVHLHRILEGLDLELQSTQRVSRLDYNRWEEDVPQCPATAAHKRPWTRRSSLLCCLRCRTLGFFRDAMVHQLDRASYRSQTALALD